MKSERSRAWALLRGLIRSEAGFMALAVGAALGFTGANLAVPTLVQLAIDRGIRRGHTGPLIRYGLTIVACAIVLAVMFAVWLYCVEVASRRIEARLRLRLFAQLQRLHLAYHDRTATGQLMGRMNTDLQQIWAFADSIPDTVSSAALLVGVLVLLIAANTTLGLILLALVAALGFGMSYARRQVFEAASRLQQELGLFSDLVENAISGIRVTKGIGAEGAQARLMRAEASRLYDRAIDWARIRASYVPIWELAPALGGAVVLWYGGHAVLRGELSVGQLVAFNTYLALLVWPITHLGGLVFTYQRAVAAARRSSEVLATEPEVAERAGARPLPPGGGEIRLEGVGFGYGGERERPVIADLDLTIPAGSSVALVGRTGAGKSTLAQLVARLYDVDRGSVRLDGEDVRDMRLAELRRAVGIVFQETFLFADSVLANIAVGDPEASDESVVAAARLAGADGFIRALPDGYDTLLGERGFSLSGGQRQRIAIARALLTEPRVLILDDATSAVDPSKEQEIRGALASVMRGRTTVVIAYRPATIALADRVVLLDGGRIAAEGTHSELLASSAEYRAVLAETAGVGPAVGTAG